MMKLNLDPVRTCLLSIWGHQSGGVSAPSLTLLAYTGEYRYSIRILVVVSYSSSKALRVTNEQR